MPHWLDRYGSLDAYAWRQIGTNDRVTFWRPLGLVESTFDSDGRHFEGRADITNQLDLAIRSSGSPRDFRQHILLAWTCLRCRHWLLQAKAVTRTGLDVETNCTEICFRVDVPSTPREAEKEASEHAVFLRDYYEDVDSLEFWQQSQNCARIVCPGVALAKLFVLPPRKDEHGNEILKVQFIGSHQIWDGLTTYIWMREFIHLLNMSQAALSERLATSIDVEMVKQRLPLPQEALYPPIMGSPARQRWSWAITRILRHVRKPLLAAFRNPLCRDHAASKALTSFSTVLDYSRRPPLVSAPCSIQISKLYTQRLHRLCREAEVSIGAGCFALAALVMMELHEMAEPGITLADRKPFVSGFPLNPRAFFNHKNEPDSLMLAFSDGIALPFLSSSLDLDGRIRLLARQAHRQLSSYQKRARPSNEETKSRTLSSRGAGLVLATQYISSIERADALQPSALRSGFDPQGKYPARPNGSGQTCGVSSVGRSDAILKRGMFDLSGSGEDFAADFRGMLSGVRARDEECLIGIGGNDEGLWINASIDLSAIDPELVEIWRDRMQRVMAEQGTQPASKL